MSQATRQATPPVNPPPRRLHPKRLWNELTTEQRARVWQTVVVICRQLLKSESVEVISDDCC